MIHLGFRILLHDRARFLATTFGVAFAVVLVFVQVGLFQGLLANSTVTIDNIAADLWVTGRATPNIDFANTFPETRVARVRGVPGVAQADNLIVAFAQMALPTGAKEGAEVYGLEHPEKWQLPWHVVSGDTADLRRGNFILVDESAVKRYGAFNVGEYRELFGVRFRIAGVTRGAKSFTTTPIVFMDFDLIQKLLGNQLNGMTNYVMVRVQPGADVEQVRHAIQARLPYNSVLTRAEWAQRSRNYWVVNTGLGMNMILTVFLGCVVGVVVVAQTLYASTMEHLREYGTVKAIGGSNFEVLRILLEQAGTAALLGFSLGAGMSLVLQSLMPKVGLSLIISPALWVGVAAGTLALCVGACLLPFVRVLRIDPAMVFRA